MGLEFEAVTVVVHLHWGDAGGAISITQREGLVCPHIAVTLSFGGFPPGWQERLYRYTNLGGLIIRKPFTVDTNCILLS